MASAVGAKRQFNLDLLRIAACYLVIMLHVAGAYWGSGDMYLPGWTGMTTYAVFTRCTVPLFVMISGKLFLERKEIPVSKFLSNYVLKLVVLYVVWGLFYAVDDIGLNAVFQNSGRSVYTQFTTAPKYHLWYLLMQTAVYLMLPVFWAVAKYEEGKYLAYICILICAVNVVGATIWAFIPTAHLLGTIMGQCGSSLAIYYGYFLLGYYVCTKKLDNVKIWHCLLVYVLSFSIATVYTVWSSRTRGEYEIRLLANYPITTFAASVAMFLAFQKMNFHFSERAGAVIQAVSRCTLFIYLFHPFVLDRLRQVGVDAVMFNPWGCIPVVSAVIFVICLIPATVLIRIPAVNKWLL